jgi:hypothetical protein
MHTDVEENLRRGAEGFCGHKLFPDGKVRRLGVRLEARPALIGLEEVECIGGRLVLANQVCDYQGLRRESPALICLYAFQKLVAALRLDPQAHPQAIVLSCKLWQAEGSLRWELTVKLDLRRGTEWVCGHKCFPVGKVRRLGVRLEARPALIGLEEAE